MNPIIFLPADFYKLNYVPVVLLQLDQLCIKQIRLAVHVHLLLDPNWKSTVTTTTTTYYWSGLVSTRNYTLMNTVNLIFRECRFCHLEDCYILVIFSKIDLYNKPWFFIFVSEMVFFMQVFLFTCLSFWIHWDINHIYNTPFTVRLLGWKCVLLLMYSFT